MSRIAAQSGWRIFRWPLAIAIVSVAGLLSALLGDRWEDVLSWLLLAGVLAVIVVAWARAR